ncbi:MAG TPA: class I SAM-dependent methyltransferase [Candidatus Acidoferrales bacterium]|nr:class I SAM-dependent methyltransferase [Candidatus Acidoferrales bacterium]
MNRPLYSQLVDYYEILEGRDWEAEVDLIAFILQGRKCTSVVDLGCGTGLHVRALTKRGFKAIGVDISKTNVSYARRKARMEGVAASFLVASYYSYRPSKPFDAAICLNWSIPVRDGEVKRFLANTRALLRPEGILIFDYERASEIVRSDLGRAMIESWDLKDKVIARSSVGQLKSNVLFSRDVYIIYPTNSGHKPPNEETRYDASKHSKNVQVYCDTSCVRFFSLTEIRKLSRNSGFRLIDNFVLPRKKYKRNYVVLQRI